MLSRVVISAVLLAALTLVLVSCDSEQPAPVGTEVPASIATPTSVSELTPTSIPIFVPTPTPMPTSGPSYLTEEIPPCTPVLGSSLDPCDPDAPPMEMGIAESLPELGDRT